jgi:hypothetical protein
VDNTITIDKTTLHFVVTYLQVLQAKATLLQTQNRLLHDALEQKNIREHFELVLVHNPIFEDDDADSDQQVAQQQLNEPAPDSNADKD